MPIWSKSVLFVVAMCVYILASTCAEARDVPDLPQAGFSLIALPDTQAYSQDDPDILSAEIDWILDNVEMQNIRFVSHVGDVVTNNEPRQWSAATPIIQRLAGRVPYGVSVGNHDMLAATGDSALFQASFPQSAFTSHAWYGGGYKNNANSFQLFEVESLKFIVLHLECNAPDEVLAWANTVLERHAGRRAIVTTHMYLGPVVEPSGADDARRAPLGRMQWVKCHGPRGNTPEQIWRKCISRHANVFLVLCGDQSRVQAMHQTSRGAHGNPVHELLGDYREGYLRVHQFLPRENQIRVWTYSPTLGELCPGTEAAPDVGEHHFTLSYEMLL